ncbi:GNAT family N-acetyltransferase [Bdellovibrio sp. HCB290]|uniref:GNAT family N-acetyltransferase n=1 Tax=Bdellovibrio sp. HCB290 TaxID=3394356 RepID=UPI0039B3A1D0
MLSQKPLPSALNGPKVSLEKHSSALAPEMFKTIDANREHLKNMPWIQFTNTVEDSKKWIDVTFAEWDNLALFDYGIYFEGKYIGSAGVHNIHWENKNCELGYWISKEFEGRGLISEVVKMLESACFKQGFHRVEIRCFSFNDASARVALKNGYKFEGELREDSLVNGEYQSTKVFGKLRGEWMKSQDSQ